MKKSECLIILRRARTKRFSNLNDSLNVARTRWFIKHANHAVNRERMPTEYCERGILRHIAHRNCETSNKRTLETSKKRGWRVETGTDCKNECDHEPVCVDNGRLVWFADRCVDPIRGVASSHVVYTKYSWFRHRIISLINSYRFFAKLRNTEWRKVKLT